MTTPTEALAKALADIFKSCACWYADTLPNVVVDGLKERGYWLPSFGPDPDSAGCELPQHLRSEITRRTKAA